MRAFERQQELPDVLRTKSMGFWHLSEVKDLTPNLYPKQLRSSMIFLNYFFVFIIQRKAEMFYFLSPN